MINTPVAKKSPKKLIKHGHTRIDNYYWLNDRKDKEVIEYLNSENSYTKKQLEKTEKLQDILFNEITGKIKQKDMSVPYLKKGYYYYTRYEDDKEYVIFCRKKESLSNNEEILLNVNELAENKSYYDIKGLSISPDNKYLAFGVDTIGRRNFTIYLKDITSGNIIETGIENTTGPLTWANNSKTIFYTRKDKTTLRSSKIYRNEIFENKEEVVYEEKDETFTTSIYKTKSEKYIIIGSHSTLSDEYQILKADTPYENFTIFQERKDKLEYSISHIDGKFYINTNHNAENFKIMVANESNTGIENWKEVIPHRNDVLIEGIDLFNNFMVISERVNSQQKIRVINFITKEDHYIDIVEEAYSIYVSINPEFNSETLRFGYNSLTTPSSIYDYNMVSREKELLKKQEVIGSFKSTDYKSKRIFATSVDGEEIPISLVYHKDKKFDKNTPLLLYAYGSYGHTIDPYFSIPRLSLLDRGYIYAIAHIRGGEIKGRKWYDDGKLLNKLNTFTDFIDCAKFLISNNYSSPDHLYAMGGSAGGMLMGGIVNMAPELFNGIIAAVPFVDVVTTMLDETIPLTTGEYDEWGNPNNKEYYDYMLSYSPYDNVKKQNYPSMLVTTGLHDSQVQYWEPAKWVAKLRDYKTDNNILLLHTDMESGHSGTTGRFKIFKDTALEYAFLLNLENIKE